MRKVGEVYLHRGTDGQVLYVGMSRFLKYRQAAHRRSVWWPLISYVEVEAALPIMEAHHRERELILQLDPPFNWMWTPAWWAAKQAGPGPIFPKPLDHPSLLQPQ
jgi:excinuclease UvrABC nuclease subunit